MNIPTETGVGGPPAPGLTSVRRLVTLHGVSGSAAPLGPDGAKAIRWLVFPHDINYDGHTDLVLFFKERKTGIQCGDTEANLVGASQRNIAFIGTDSIKAEDCAPE